jgi:hypothetical protein
MLVPANLREEAAMLPERASLKQDAIIGSAIPPGREIFRGPAKQSRFTP